MNNKTWLIFSFMKIRADYLKSWFLLQNFGFTLGLGLASRFLLKSFFYFFTRKKQLKKLNFNKF